MTVAESVETQPLSLPEELILMLLNEENGYFYQVAGWDLNCAVVGAALAELSLQSRIDTDLESLFLVDDTETGQPYAGPHPQRDRLRAGTTQRPVLDRTTRAPRRIHHRPASWNDSSPWTSSNTMTATSGPYPASRLPAPRCSAAASPPASSRPASATPSSTTNCRFPET